MGSVESWMQRTFGRDFLHDVVEVNFTWRWHQNTQDPNYAHMDDDVIPSVVGLSRLRKLSLFYGQATDESFKAIGQLTSLEELEVHEAASVTDSGIACIENLSHLRSLTVADAPLTDRSLTTVSRLPSLERLKLCNGSGVGGQARFTDDGLMALAKCKNLRELVVRETGVSEFGANALKAQLPGCSIDAAWNGPRKVQDGHDVPDVEMAEQLGPPRRSAEPED